MNFGEYLKSFDYQERKAMKINIPTLLNLQKKGKVTVLDIRFPEETAAWQVSMARQIPLNELPERLDELDRNQLIVTVCPHSDRASMARHYLALQGFQSRYLVEGLLGLVDYLRGDHTREIE